MQPRQTRDYRRVRPSGRPSPRVADATVGFEGDWEIKSDPDARLVLPDRPTTVATSCSKLVPDGEPKITRGTNETEPTPELPRGVRVAEEHAAGKRRRATRSPAPKRPDNRWSSTDQCHAATRLSKNAKTRMCAAGIEDHRRRRVVDRSLVPGQRVMHYHERAKAESVPGVL
jgi:hypothetical protein